MPRSRNRHSRRRASVSKSPSRSHGRVDRSRSRNRNKKRPNSPSESHSPFSGPSRRSDSVSSTSTEDFSHVKDSARQEFGTQSNNDGNVVVQTKEINGEISCSVEETNRLRAMLGMKPLNTLPASSKLSQPFEVQRNLIEERKLESEREELQNRLNIARSKITANTSRSTVSLGDIRSDEDFSANAWVARSRLLVNKSSNNKFQDNNAPINSDSTSNSLTILHSQSKLDRMLESSNNDNDVILTLKDEPVIDISNGKLIGLHKADDVLENVFLVDQEKLDKKNRLIERSKRFAKYTGHDEQDSYKDGKRVILAKYDSDSSGGEDCVDERPVQSTLMEFAPTNDIMTQQEAMTVLKKKTEVSGFRKKTGSSQHKREVVWDQNAKPMMLDAVAAVNVQKRVMDDEDALLVQRRHAYEVAKQKAEARLTAAVAPMHTTTSSSTTAARQQFDLDANGRRRSDNKLIMNPSIEFSSLVSGVFEMTIDNDDVVNTARRKLAQEEEQMMVPDEFNVKEIEQQEEEIKKHQIEDEVDASATTLSDQPIIKSGLSTALAFLRSTGGLVKGTKEAMMGRTKDGRADVSDSGVRLEYRDEQGRLQTQKQEYRNLSYKFHGHKPGKQNRLRDDSRNEQATNELQSTMIQSGSMIALQQVQQATGSAEMMIQGSANIGSSALNDMLKKSADDIRAKQLLQEAKIKESIERMKLEASKKNKKKKKKSSLVVVQVE